jgi:hypothetical protein
VGEPVGTESWIVVCRGQFEKTGICRRQECVWASLKKLVYVGGRRKCRDRFEKAGVFARRQVGGM